MPNCIAVDHSL